MSEGGAFCFHGDPGTFDVLRHIQTELLGEGITGIGIAFLDYCNVILCFFVIIWLTSSDLALAPQAHFPIPLRQANDAIAFLFASGLAPENLQIAGESAGGNLVLQVLSHALHPLSSIPLSPLASSFAGEHRPVKGAFLISPWVIPRGSDGGSFDTNDKNDLVSKKALCDWGLKIVNPVPLDERSYIEPSLSSMEWFRDAPRVIERFLITAGGYEVLRDDILAFANRHLSSCEDVTVILQEQGVHVESLYTLTKEIRDQDGETILKWFKTGFQ